MFLLFPSFFCSSARTSSFLATATVQVSLRESNVAYIEGEKRRSGCSLYCLNTRSTDELPRLPGGDWSRTNYLVIMSQFRSNRWQMAPNNVPMWRTFKQELRKK